MTETSLARPQAEEQRRTIREPAMAIVDGVRVWTVTLKDQGIARPAQIAYLFVSEAPQCEHEVRDGKAYRRCKAKPTMVVDGSHLCTTHGRIVRDRV